MVRKLSMAMIMGRITYGAGFAEETGKHGPPR